MVLSDIRMPGMNGYEFLKQVKNINLQVKVIFMTAFDIDDKEFYNVLPSIKVDAFLQKPFSIGQLNDQIGKSIAIIYNNNHYYRTVICNGYYIICAHFMPLLEYN
jgi:two-component SAPR family response regulator